jgi:hypothetical protein
MGLLLSAPNTSAFHYPYPLLHRRELVIPSPYPYSDTFSILWDWTYFPATAAGLISAADLGRSSAAPEAS